MTLIRGENRTLIRGENRTLIRAKNRALFWAALYRGVLNDGRPNAGASAYRIDGFCASRHRLSPGVAPIFAARHSDSPARKHVAPDGSMRVIV